MTPPQHRVDLDELENVIARLNGLAGFVHDRLDELDRRVGALHTSSWSGTAAAAHADAHREWSADAKEFNDGIAEMRDAAKNAHTNYDKAINTNRRIFRSS